jgi:hypothetical protein
LWCHHVITSRFCEDGSETVHLGTGVNHLQALFPRVVINIIKGSSAPLARQFFFIPRCSPRPPITSVDVRPVDFWRHFLHALFATVDGLRRLTKSANA